MNDTPTPTPPTPRAPGWKILALAVLSVAVCLPPFLAGLKSSDTTFHMEVITLVSSQETWLRQDAGEPGAWLMPSWNGRQRIEKPPLTIWMNMLAWRNLDPQTAPPEQLLYRARLIGVALVALALLATFAAGLKLGDARTGALATLATGTMILMIRQTRLASYDTYLASWLTMSIAAGFWSIHDTRPGRVVLGWLVSGLALAGAVLSKGPLAYGLMAAPLLLAGLVVPTGRGRNLLGLAAALAVGTAIAAPWFVYVFLFMPGAKETLAYEYQAVQHDVQPIWYYLCVFYLSFPWMLWLIAGTANPFRAANPEDRRRLWPAWLWFVAVVVIMSVPDAKHQRYIVPVLPAAGLLVAQYLLAPNRRVPRFAIWIHWGLILIASVAGPAFVLLQGPLLARGVIEQIEFVDLGGPAFFFACGALVALAVIGLRRQLAGRRYAAAWVTACWMSLLATTLFTGYAKSWHNLYNGRGAAARIRELAKDSPLQYLLPEEGKVYIEEPDQKFLFYARRIIPKVVPADLKKVAKSQRPVYVIARAESAIDELMKQNRFEPVMDFTDDDIERRLYRSPSGPAE
jgi:4-amino-4-deoxy-L-arabinose transferase-like glycosyltransferase